MTTVQAITRSRLPVTWVDFALMFGLYIVLSVMVEIFSEDAKNNADMFAHYRTRSMFLNIEKPPAASVVQEDPEKKKEDAEKS